ncbi:MAG: hypothetical protein QXF76_02170, partial [Candidatus Anstonellales archaeon]
ELKGKDKENLEKGIITELDINVSKILYPLLKDVENLEIVRAIQSDETLLTILVRGNESVLFKNDGNCISTLSKELKKKIRVVPITHNPEITLASLFNVKFIKIEEKYFKENLNNTVVTFYLKSKDKNTKQLEELKSVLSYLYQKDVEIILE